MAAHQDLLRGLEERSKGNPVAAVSLFSSALQKVHQQHQGVFISRSQVYLEMGQTELAAKDALSAISLQPFNGRGQACLAQVFLTLGRLQEGLNMAAQACVWSPYGRLPHEILCQSLRTLSQSPDSLSLSAIVSHPAVAPFYRLALPEGLFPFPSFSFTYHSYFALLEPCSR